jgi:hypothetical protein
MLSSNPLFCYFNELRTTQTAVDVDWRILAADEASADVLSRAWSAAEVHRAAFPEFGRLLAGHVDTDWGRT